jgi:hypothetical protein
LSKIFITKKGKQMNVTTLKQFLSVHRKKIALISGVILFVFTLFYYFYANQKAVAIAKNPTSSSQIAPVTIVNPNANAVPSTDLSALTTKLKAKQIDDTSFLLLFLLASGALIVYSVISTKKERS